MSAVGENLGLTDLFTQLADSFIQISHPYANPALIHSDRSVKLKHLRAVLYDVLLFKSRIKAK